MFGGPTSYNNFQPAGRKKILMNVKKHHSPVDRHHSAKEKEEKVLTEITF